MKHDHKPSKAVTVCKHPAIKLCAQCNTVFCEAEDCTVEWRVYPAYAIPRQMDQKVSPFNRLIGREYYSTQAIPTHIMFPDAGKIPDGSFTCHSPCCAHP